MFAAVKAMLEDMHGIAVEGQRRDNAPDMQRVLISQLRTTAAAVEGRMDEIKSSLGDVHD